MVVEFITACAISAYHHKGCEFEPLLIQTYVIKFVSDLQEVCGILCIRHKKLIDYIYIKYILGFNLNTFESLQRYFNEAYTETSGQ
jgi:hypothetical protein